MYIGVPKEIKNREYRVGLTPESVSELTTLGHKVCIETNAGLGIGANDESYQKAGAIIHREPEEVYEKSELIVKVKEPLPSEWDLIRPGQALFTYFHLAADLEQVLALQRRDAICIAYETVSSDNGTRPLLTPMSVVAGRLSIQVGAHCLEKAQGGSGILLGGVPGVEPAKVLVIGGGIVGENAIAMALGLGAEVTVLDNNIDTLERLAHQFGPRLITLFSSQTVLEDKLHGSDLVIGSVLIPGASAPKLVTRNMIKNMKENSVMVDVAIDQGGCFETSHPTTHDQPTYSVNHVLHYCVTNMPGAVPKTSTYALNHVTLPYVKRLANDGIDQALQQHQHLGNGLNIYRGEITNQAVADSLGLKYKKLF
jgi:alanine dehydrogenase